MMMIWTLFSIIFIILTISSVRNEKVNVSSCTITNYNADDILNAQRDCTEIVLNGINVPPGDTLDLTKLRDASKVTFKGRITWGYKEWKGQLLKVSGKNVKITGSSDHILDGRGMLWWDGLGGNGGKMKPKLFNAIKLQNSIISNINIKNSPIHVFSIKSCEGLIIQNVTIDNRDGDLQGGHNTDGFDISDSNNVTIEYSTVFNQDDCLAIKSGSNFTFINNFCSGGHGISIGSVGNTTVDTVDIANCHVEYSANGVRIKTVYGAVGSVNNITYRDITLKDITNYGIVIEGDYENGGSTGIPSDDFPITNLTLKNITGTVKSSGMNIYVLVRSASFWNCSEIYITGGEKIEKCTGIPLGSGITC